MSVRQCVCLAMLSIEAYRVSQDRLLSDRMRVSTLGVKKIFIAVCISYFTATVTVIIVTSAIIIITLFLNE